MARKDIDTLRRETLAQRFEVYKLITFENHPLDRALKMVLHDSKTRKRTFTGWQEKGLWPISEEEEKLIELPPIGPQVQEALVEPSVEIFPNPSPDQARNLVNEDGQARYLVDSVTKNVFFWSADHSHNKVRKILKERRDTKDVGSDLAITGVATLKEDRFHVDRIYEPEAYATASKFQNPDAERFFEMDWSWAYQWLVGLEENFEENREKFRGGTIDQDIPAVPIEVTQPAPAVTQAETSIIKEVSDECATPPQEHTEEVEPEPVVVTQEVFASTQQTDQAPDPSAQPSFPHFQRAEIEEMIRTMVQGEVQKVIASIGSSQAEKKEITLRPLFKRAETVTRSIRISKAMAEQAESKAKADRTWTGGNLNALIEVLLWEYLDRPDELIEEES